jgi:thiol-disulfide isomerase/thioredoxin
MPGDLVNFVAILGVVILWAFAPTSLSVIFLLPMQRWLFSLICGIGLLLSASAQSVPTLDYAGLKAYMAEQSQHDTTVVYNFWATWCRPCVAEMPSFQRVDSAYAARKVKVVFVSLDFPDQKNRLEAFVQRKGIEAEVLHLDENDQNAMINGVSPDWSGSIPATLIIGPELRAFKEQSFTYQGLTTWLDEVLMTTKK